MKDEAPWSRQRVLRHARRRNSPRAWQARRGGSRRRNERQGRRRWIVVAREGSQRRSRPNRRAAARMAPPSFDGPHRASPAARSLQPPPARRRYERAHQSRVMSSRRDHVAAASQLRLRGATGNSDGLAETAACSGVDRRHDAHVLRQHAVAGIGSRQQ